VERLPGLLLTTVFWGEKTLDVFCRVALRNAATLVGEIPDDVRSRSTYIVVTRPEEARFIDNHPLIVHLRAKIAVEIRDTFDNSDPDSWGYYGPMVAAQENLVAEAAEKGLGILFWGPDLLFSAGSLRQVVERANQGYRIVIGPSARANEESMLPALDRLAGENDIGGLSLTGLALAKLLFQHWHNMNELYVWNKPLKMVDGAFLYYRVSHQAILMKYLQGPTFFAWPRAGSGKFTGFIDHHLTRYCARSDDEIYIVPDCRELLTVDLTAPEREYDIPSAGTHHLDLIKLAINRRFVGDFNLLYAERTTRIYGTEVPEADWRACERALNAEVNPSLAIARLIRRLPAVPWKHLIGQTRGTQMWLNTTFRWMGFLVRPFLRAPPRTPRARAAGAGPDAA